MVHLPVTRRTVTGRPRETGPTDRPITVKKFPLFDNLQLYMNRIIPEHGNYERFYVAAVRCETYATRRQNRSYHGCGVGNRSVDGRALRRRRGSRHRHRRRHRGGRAVAEAIEDSGGDAEFHELDVTDSDQFHAVVDAVAEDDGLDVMVNNAGTGHPAGSLETLEDDLRDFVIDINVKGVWNGCHAALPTSRNRATVPSSTSARWRASSGSRSSPPTR